MLRLVTLMNVRSHVIANAAISPYRKGEIPWPSEFIHPLPDKSVTRWIKVSVPTCCCVFRPKTPTVTGSSRNARGWYTRNLSAMATVTVCCK